MSYRGTLEVPLPTLRALLEYQTEQANDCELSELADLAIREWLQRQRAKTRPAPPAGYGWKKIFLPDGTRLRVKSCSGVHYAEIVCGELIYEARPLSPNQFVTACLGNVGNAWMLIYVQLPGEGVWTQALRLRHAAEAEARRTEKRRTELTGASAPPAHPAPAGKPA
ncbi:hypothetical protein [Pseudoduganella sp. OTU4001]|uniref:hypothetical protein n=1 Tax=Pseudoduganella sp. OTU4001 TaxID=3043854 RepID=UPI00313D2954